MIESIAFLPRGEAWFHPTRVEICRRVGSPGGIVFQRYTTNYGGPLRKELNVKEGTSMQVFASVLANVTYRIYADVRGQSEGHGRNTRHFLVDLFQRRLRQGRCHRTPSLGWSEFTADYWGAARPDWEVDVDLDLEIPSMLACVWDRPRAGAYAARFSRDMKIEKGVLHFAE